MKEVLLVAAFGSTVDQAREQQILPMVEAIRKAFPQLDVRMAFTSRIVVSRLRDKGILVDTEETAVQKMLAEGITSLTVQPLHFMGGAEYDKLKTNILSYQGQGNLKTIKMGRPLFYYMGQAGIYPDDYDLFIDAFIQPFMKEKQIGPDEALFLVGHGGLHIGNAGYSVLQLKLWHRGLSNVRVAALEGYPMMRDTLLNADWMGSIPSKHIHMHPLLLVAGDHVNNDLFGQDEDSLVKQLDKVGYEVTAYPYGLGQYTSVQQLFVRHAEDAFKHTYLERMPKQTVSK